MEKCDKEDDWKIKKQMAKHRRKWEREIKTMEDNGKKIFMPIT